MGNAKEKSVSDMRVSKTSWLWDETAPDKVVPTVSKRIDMITGLSTQLYDINSHAEAFQLVNYGLAGQYEPHHDYFETFGTDGAILPSNLQGSGDRMATFMLYLSDVEAGGATVFPVLNIRVPPVKNGAAFWFNLQPSGDGDPRTEHAGCPVLMGEKWIANKWIWSHGQMFRKPCTNDIHFI